MALTQDCLTTHIKNIQCLYKDLANKYVEKLKIGKICKEAETALLIIEEYLESFYCFEVPLVATNKYRILIVLDVYVVDSLSFILTNGTDEWTITMSGGGYTDAVQVANGIVAALEALGFTVTVTEISPGGSTYVYIESTNEIYENLTLPLGDINVVLSGGGGGDIFGIGMNDNGSISPDEVLENCLTTDQICCMIAHSYKLLKECNC